VADIARASLVFSPDRLIFAQNKIANTTALVIILPEYSLWSSILQQKNGEAPFPAETPAASLLRRKVLLQRLRSTDASHRLATTLAFCPGRAAAERFEE
jgi:hypothetical protein